MMLRWLAGRKADAGLAVAADRIEAAVGAVLREGRAVPRDLGGGATCTEVADAVRRALA